MTDNIGGYDVNLRAHIGRGAIGIVYKAKNKDGSTVAAKQVDATMAEKKLVRELENSHQQQRLNHENIVKILHIHNDEEHEDIWIFMEYLSGGDLNKYAKNNFARFQETKLDLMIQISKGLAFLHDLRICHRDIKPENILIQPRDSDQQSCVKLTDFGLAKFQRPDEPSSVMHTKLGTQNYMAPEFWDTKPDGTIDYHKSVDVYALGLTFLAMIDATEGQNLKPVPEGRKQAESGQPTGLIMFTRHMYDQPELDVVTLREGDDYKIKALKGLIKQATWFEPEKRLNAQEMLEPLDILQVISSGLKLSMEVNKGC